MNTLAQAYAEQRLIRSTWARTAPDGRQLLCLYTALAGDPEARPGTCPAELCPAWLAHLLPWIDDAGTAEAWPGVVRRVVALSPRFGELSGARSERLRSRCLAHIVREAQSHVPPSDAIANVLALLDRHGAGGDVSPSEWHAAEQAAAADATAAAWAAAAWAAAAAEAAEAAAAAAVWAAWAAEAAAEAAAWAAAWAAEAAAALRAAADRMIDAMLTEIEREIAGAA